MFCKQNTGRGAVIGTKYVQNMTQKMREIQEIGFFGHRPNQHCGLIS